MLTLYHDAKVTKAEADVLHQAVDILINANSKAGNWPRTDTETRSLTEHTKVRVHTIDEGDL